MKDCGCSDKGQVFIYEKKFDNTPVSDFKYLLQNVGCSNCSCGCGIIRNIDLYIESEQQKYVKTINFYTSTKFLEKRSDQMTNIILTTDEIETRRYTRLPVFIPFKTETPDTLYVQLYFDNPYGTFNGFVRVSGVY